MLFHPLFENTHAHTNKQMRLVKLYRGYCGWSALLERPLGSDPVENQGITAAFLINVHTQ